MEILKRLLESLPKEPIPVRKLIIGVHWTLVCSRYGGLGSTLTSCGPHGHSHMENVGALHKKSAQELAHWVLSDNLLEASVGIAALNSILSVDDQEMVQINAADVIAREGKGKNVVIVGHFPFVSKLQTITQNCWVVEKRPFGDDFPEESAKEFIPQADVVAITGTAFINHTMTGLLSLCQPNAKVMVLGPSTPLSPILYDYGISFLSGSRVIDEENAALTIQQGASFPQVNGVKLITIMKEL